MFNPVTCNACKGNLMLILLALSEIIDFGIISHQLKLKDSSDHLPHFNILASYFLNYFKIPSHNINNFNFDLRLF